MILCHAVNGVWILSGDDNAQMHFKAETDVVGQGGREAWAREKKKRAQIQEKMLYLQLQVFHTQSPGYSAQGHNKSWVSEFQTEHRKNDQNTTPEISGTKQKYQSAVTGIEEATKKISYYWLWCRKCCFFLVVLVFSSSAWLLSNLFYIYSISFNHHRDHIVIVQTTLSVYICLRYFQWQHCAVLS